MRIFKLFLMCFYLYYFLSVSCMIEKLLSERYGYTERRVLCFRESQEDVKARALDHQEEIFRVVLLSIV